jgi:hypothetical protein
MRFVVRDTLIEFATGRTLTGLVDLSTMTRDEQALWLPLVERSVAQGFAAPEGVKLDAVHPDTGILLPGGATQTLDSSTRKDAEESAVEAATRRARR